MPIKPAAENPWYVLATIYGEQTDDQWDYNLHARNRRIWNGWYCGQMSAPKRAQLAKMTKLSGGDFEPLTDLEQTVLAKRFNILNILCPSCWLFSDFSHTNFIFPLNMSGFYLNGININDSIVAGNADFSFAVFEEIALFTSCNFEKRVSFFCSAFNEVAIFDSVRFNRRTQFGTAIFNRNVYFTDAIFGDAAAFVDTLFKRPTSFRATRFLTHFPALSGAILHPNTTFTAKDICWPETEDAHADESRESLAIIRHALGKQGLPEEEHYFYRREMAFAARIGTPLQRFPYQAFGVLSDFGYSLAKPVLWLAGVWFVGLLAYSYWLTCLAPAQAVAHPIFTAAGFSVAQLFGFLGFTGSYFGTEFLDALPTALKVLAGFQTVAGVVLLFFLGLGLRNRFRLK